MTVVSLGSFPCLVNALIPHDPVYFVLGIDASDLQGPEIRTGFFANDRKTVELKRGQDLELVTDYDFLGDESTVSSSLVLSRSHLIEQGDLNHFVECQDGINHITVSCLTVT